MRLEEFEETLRQLIRHEPFQPFVVELLEGTAIQVKEPSFVFAGGGATYISPDWDWIEFSCEHVRAIQPAHHEKAS